jgi:hypothetical protein
MLLTALLHRYSTGTVALCFCTSGQRRTRTLAPRRLATACVPSTLNKRTPMSALYGSNNSGNWTYFKMVDRQRKARKQFWSERHVPLLQVATKIALFRPPKAKFNLLRKSTNTLGREPKVNTCTPNIIGTSTGGWGVWRATITYLDGTDVPVLIIVMVAKQSIVKCIKYNTLSVEIMF